MWAVTVGCVGMMWKSFWGPLRLRWVVQLVQDRTHIHWALLCPGLEQCMFDSLASGMGRNRQFASIQHFLLQLPVECPVQFAVFGPVAPVAVQCHARTVPFAYQEKAASCTAPVFLRCMVQRQIALKCMGIRLDKLDALFVGASAVAALAVSFYTAHCRSCVGIARIPKAGRVVVLAAQHLFHIVECVKPQSGELFFEFIETHESCDGFLQREPVFLCNGVIVNFQNVQANGRQSDALKVAKPVVQQREFVGGSITTMQRYDQAASHLRTAKPFDRRFRFGSHLAGAFKRSRPAGIVQWAGPVDGNADMHVVGFEQANMFFGNQRAVGLDTIGSVFL
jgi:hypothetical protein